MVGTGARELPVDDRGVFSGCGETAVCEEAGGNYLTDAVVLMRWPLEIVNRCTA